MQVPKGTVLTVVCPKGTAGIVSAGRAAWCWGQCRQTKGVGWKGSTAWVCETLELLDSHQRKKCKPGTVTHSLGT